MSCWNRTVLSTIPRTMVSENRLRRLNEVVIDLVEQMIDVYDWDAIVWREKSVDKVSESALFRDTHPSESVSAAFGKFLMHTRTQHLDAMQLGLNRLQQEISPDGANTKHPNFECSGLLRSVNHESYLSRLTVVVKAFNRPTSLLKCLRVINIRKPCEYYCCERWELQG